VSYIEASVEVNERSLKTYEQANGKRPFEEWLNNLKDGISRARIRSRLDMVAIGNFGNFRSVGEGVSELRFTFGPGFRVYYAQKDEVIVILLIGGDKSSQEKDIEKATTRREQMSKASVDYREALIETLRGNEEEQILYLKATLEDNWDAPEAFLLSLKTIAEARGFKNFAEEAGLSRESLYRTLSANGNPKLDTVFKMLHALGLKLTVEPIEKKVS
jgi:putative addiction module killer protein/probable addiction module antidote protein